MYLNVGLTYPSACMYLARIYKLFCLSAFQLHNTMLSTTVTVFYVRSSGHGQLVTKSFYPLNNLFLCSPTPACWQPPCYSVPMNLTFFSISHRINTTQYLSFSVWLISDDWSSSLYNRNQQNIINQLYPYLKINK